MKTGIHPQVYETKIHCNGCNINFTSHTTVKEIEVEICSNCHPFYTGKQKLIDTANRVAKFNARQAEATKRAETRAEATNAKDKKTAKIQKELQTETIEAEKAKETPAEA